MSTSGDRAWHYISPGSTSRWPRQHIFLDTEARTVRAGKTHTQTWRLGVGIFRSSYRGRPVEEAVTTFRTATDLWTEVTRWIPRRGRAILWSHNLGYDLRISRALTVLPAMGWQLTGHNLGPAGTWLTWRRNEQSLITVDSTSHLPTSLAQLAKNFQRAKAPLPAETARDELWERRCLRDAEILRDMVCAYLERLERHDLGGWQFTGTGQAWAAFKRHHVTHGMLVHWDPDARAAERRAMWTGRCEAYWHGRLRRVRVDEWDMTLAYPRIALQGRVPVELATTFTGTRDMTRWLGRDDYAVLAEVEVTTSEPLVPCEIEGRIAWPVGTFRTTLWCPEIRLLLARGQQVTCLRGWAYRTEPALQSWAAWIVRELHASDEDSPAWWRTVLKHWARGLIGRMAMTHCVWEMVGRAPRSAVRRAVYVDADTGARGELVQVGHEVFVTTERVEWESSIPQITGWIQSTCRVDITNILLQAGARVPIYADTDSLLTTEEHHDTMAALAASHPQLGLRLKRSWQGVEIKGPRQIITGKRVRVSGVPIKAERMPDGSIAGEVWQSLAAAMAARTPTAVRIDARRWHLRGVDSRRIVGPDGWTTPIEVHMPESTAAA